MSSNETIDEKEIVSEVLKDFNERREKRRPFEQSWLLNINFLIGNQYSYISPRGEVVEKERLYPYESREVFNHIAPIIESRLAKLNRVRPALGVRPCGLEESDIQTAKLCKSILDGVSSSLNISDIVGKATLWSEVTGTCFYKIVWNENAGNIIGYEKNGKIYSAVENDGERVVFSGDKNEELLVEVDKQNNLPASGEKKISVADSANGVQAETNSEVDASLASCAKGSTFGLGNFKPVYDGDVSVTICSPFEIFPEDMGEGDLSCQASIIQAKSVDASVIEELYGITVKGETIDAFTYDFVATDFLTSGSSNVMKTVGGKKDNQVLLIERWQKPNSVLPNGRLTIVAGSELVYDGDMPYSVYPFVKQVSSDTIGSFWGTSIIDRCLPIQRSYNAIKNRKIELLSRLSSGVLLVEEGSVDIDDLEEEGLAPGKIVVYKAGSNIPSIMNSGSLPSVFSEEEDRLYNELINLTGVSEFMRNSTLPNSVTSGTAINLLIEQDDTRLSVPAENIRTSVLNISKMVIKLYKEKATAPKLAKIVDGDGELEIFYWKGSDITSDDIVLETSNELNETIATKRNTVLELYKLGLFSGNDGQISERNKAKIIEMLGFGNFESGQDEVSLQVKRAKKENITNKPIVVLEVDDHQVHIAEHTKKLLELGEKDEKQKRKLIEHIRAHKQFIKIETKNKV